MYMGKNEAERQQEHQEKKYQFIKEQVRPQRKKDMMEILRHFLRVLCSAVLFGGVAGGIIILLQNNFSPEEKKVIKIQEYSAAPTATNSPIPTGKVGKRNSFDLNQVTERMAAVGDRASTSLVGVRSINGTNSLFGENKSDDGTVFGLVFQESKKNFYILTNCDNVKQQGEADIILMDQSVVRGNILGRDYQINLAVISIEKQKISQDILGKMEVLPLNSSGNLVNGSNVVAVGCPNGVFRSVMLGRVTNNDIVASVTDNELRLYTTDICYSEKSNGVVLDTEGNVIGIIARDYGGYTGTGGLAFVDVFSIQSSVNLLRRGKSAPYMGVEAITLEDAAAGAHGLPAGAYVTAVYSKSPAYNAGMRVADVITKVDGREISGMGEVYQLLLQHKKGDSVTCTISRKSGKSGKSQVQKNIKIKLG